MGLPKQLRKQIKQGQEIEEQLRKEQDEAGVTDTSQAEIDTLLAEVDPQAAPAGAPTAEVTELHPKPEGGEPEVTPEPKPERTDWKQKYSVLKGKYDAEVPRLSEQVRDANTRINGLEDRLAAMAPAPAPEPEDKPRTDFTPEEIADYGEDLLDVMGRKAREIVESEYSPQIKTLTAEVNSLKVQLGETGQKVAKQETNEVFAQLDGTVKDWRKVNVDPAFHVWLDQVDPFTGESRKNLMLNAFNRKNAQQVKAFFDKYAEENATVIQDPTAGPSGQGGNQAATLDLENYIAPGQPRSGGDVGAPKDKRVWTNAEIGAFYSDVQKGRYKTRPEDKARIEADIVAATKEGRIR
jgi:hypothetical protein